MKGIKRNVKTAAKSGSINIFPFSEWKEMQKTPRSSKDIKTSLSWFGCMKNYSLFTCSAAILFLIMYISATFLHNETYVWQSTIMADYIRPVNRTRCLDFPPLAINQPNPRIAVTYVYNNKDGGWDENLMNEIVENRKTYCLKHGYTLVNGNEFIDPTRPTAWSKLLIVKNLIADKKFDYVFYIDMDAVIMNMNMRVENFISASRYMNPSIIDQDFIMTGDWNGPNTGVWIVKASAFSAWFLKIAWSEGKQFAMSEKAPDGTPYPFEYEQRVFHYLLDTQIWRERKLPRYAVSDNSKSDVERLYTSDQIKTHFAFLPQCSFNSYSLHPLHMKGSENKETGQYINGDFLIRFAGKKGSMKTKIMQHYLSLSKTLHVNQPGN